MDLQGLLLMDIKNLFEKTKSNKDMLSEYENKGVNPSYIYVVKKSIFEEFTDENGEKDYESKSYIKGLSLSDKPAKSDEYVDGKILIPFDYANIFRDKNVAMDVLFLDIMAENTKEFDRAVYQKEGLEQSDFVYQTFLDNYKKQYIHHQGFEKFQAILKVVKNAGKSAVGDIKEAGKDIKAELEKAITANISDEKKQKIVAASIVAVGTIALMSMEPEVEDNSSFDYRDYEMEQWEAMEENKANSDTIYVMMPPEKTPEAVQKKEEAKPETKPAPSTPKQNKKIEEVREKVQAKDSVETKKPPVNLDVKDITTKPVPVTVTDSIIREKLDQTKNIIKGVPLYSNRFNEFFKNLLGEEGEYGTNDKDEIEKLRAAGIKVNFIDQPTKFGITQKTLKKLKKDYPDLYKHIDHVRDIDLKTAKAICHKHYYQPYKIDEIKDPVLAEQCFDIMYNHSYKTGRNKLIVGGINKFAKSKDNKAKERKFKTWADIKNYMNGLDELDTAKLNLEIAKLRDDFMGKSKQFKKGLTARSGRFLEVAQNKMKEAEISDKFIQYASTLNSSKGGMNS